MTARVKVEELPSFDAPPYLDSEEAIATHLTDIQQANDEGCGPPLWVTSPALVA